MNESIIVSTEVKQYFSARTTLAALGMKVCEMKLFEPIDQEVKIAQKKVKYTPIEKLIDAEIAILAGAHGMVEINKRVRPERGLQAAFGRAGCAEQSVVQDTLDGCTEENVVQMQAALDLIYRQHSQGYRHNYKKGWQLLDADMTGRPCGKKAAFATKGYFAKQRNRRGRQEGYLIATHYEEIVAKQLFDGGTQLTKALRLWSKLQKRPWDWSRMKKNDSVPFCGWILGVAALTRSTGFCSVAISFMARITRGRVLRIWLRVWSHGLMILAVRNARSVG